MVLERVWVVGGKSGIGQAVSDYLINDPDGPDLLVTGREVDVRRPDQIKAKIIEAEEFMGGGIDGLVYSAGINYMAWSGQVSPRQMLDIYNVNVVGLINCLAALGAPLRCVVVGSDAAWRPLRQSVMYCASKAALHHAVKVIARERASEFFSINCVAPGVTAGTEMTEHVDRYVSRARPELDHLTYERSQIPLGRRADPDEIAKVIVDVLYSPPYLNGAIIPVNGAR